jgi:hypothetical protein
LLYDSENWTIKARDETRISAVDMKHMRSTAAYTWADHKTNAEVSKELNITPVLDTVQDYAGKWIKHINRMLRNGLLRLI